MLRVIIRSIGDQYVLDDRDYVWTLRNLNKPLRVMSITFNYFTDNIETITVRADDANVITLFVDPTSNNVAYDLVGGLPIKSYREVPNA